MVAVIVATVLLVAVVTVVPAMTRGRGGKILAFVALFGLPAKHYQNNLVPQDKACWTKPLHGVQTQEE